ncbi:hypothetical protein HMI54_000232 [Coelomomyces lativittatus]|nr:hypothetical protein HMI54_000232 [Coelomomyces lativittatus]
MKTKKKVTMDKGSKMGKEWKDESQETNSQKSKSQRIQSRSPLIVLMSDRVFLLKTTARTQHG